MALLFYCASSIVNDTEPTQRGVFTYEFTEGISRKQTCIWRSNLFRYGLWGKDFCILISVYVSVFLMGESIAPCAWAGVGLVVSPVERVKGLT